MHVQGRRKQLVVALAVHRGTYRRSVRAKRGKNFFTFIFQSSGLALVAPWCFATLLTGRLRSTRTGQTMGTPHCHCYAVSEQTTSRGVGNERNLVHLVEKSVEIKLKS